MISLMAVRATITYIYLDSDRNGVLGNGDEEAAFVKGNSNLDLASTDFNFVQTSRKLHYISKSAKSEN